jgi:NTP pyrophosphatase (non-canonical NTP hydrolase)
MPTLPTNPSLRELQHYQDVLCKERGWDKASDLETFLLFSEEVGELAKAIRNHKKLYIDQAKAVPAVEGELTELQAEFSDVFSYLLELANKFDVDLEDAFRKKEEKNAARVWK